MAKNFTPLNLDKEKAAPGDSKVVDNTLFAVAILTAVVLIVLIIILIQKNKAASLQPSPQVQPQITPSPTTTPVIETPTSAASPSPKIIIPKGLVSPTSATSAPTTVTTP